MSQKSLPETNRLGVSMLWEVLWTQYKYRWQSVKMLLIFKYFLMHFFLTINILHYSFWNWKHFKIPFLQEVGTISMYIQQTQTWLQVVDNSQMERNKTCRFFTQFAIYIFDYSGFLFVFFLYKKAPLTHYMSLDAPRQFQLKSDIYANKNRTNYTRKLSNNNKFAHLFS